MGEVKHKIELENYVDRFLADEGKIDNGAVRKVTVNALVDTGATMLVVPQEVVERLGLRVSRKVIVTYADARKDERDVTGGVIIKIGERHSNVECIVGPPNSEVLIGQVVLEVLDLIVDPKDQKLTPRPESPFLPLLNLK
ncbi:MAG: clan AA aspartic protease [bacterium]